MRRYSSSIVRVLFVAPVQVPPADTHVTRVRTLPHQEHPPWVLAEGRRSRAIGIEREELPKNMSLLALADRCMSEINNYRRREASNDRYCLEIFRRAMLEHDNAAWELLKDRFMEYMLG